MIMLTIKNPVTNINRVYRFEEWNEVIVYLLQESDIDSGAVITITVL